MKFKISNAFLIILFLLFFILSLNLNFVDSDSGREIARSQSLYNGGKFDGGPLITQGMYSILFFLVSGNPFLIIKFLSVFLLALILIVSLKILDNFGSKETQKVIFMLLIISVFPLFSIVFYSKPYLFLIFFLVLSFYYFSNYVRYREKKFLILSSALLAVSVLVKNHAYPFIIFPFIFLFLGFLKERKINFKSLACYALPIILILTPYLLFNITLLGIKFWHFPNTWFFTSGLNEHISSEFWGYPKALTSGYFMGHWNFLFLSVPLLIFAFLFLIHSFKYNKNTFKFFSVLLVLSILPFVAGVMPPYQQYNYIISLILIFMVSLAVGSISSLKNKNLKILSAFTIFIVSFILIISNVLVAIDANAKSTVIIDEFKQFENKINRHGNLLVRDFKLQPFSKNLYFVTASELDKESIINIFSNESNQKELSHSLSKNDINFLLFYKNRTYNEIYYSVLMSFLNMTFSMDKFEKSDFLEKVYEGDQIIVFKLKNDTLH